MRLRLILVAVLVAALSGFATTRTSADSGAGTWQYLIATDFLCSLLPQDCPAVAMAADGDTIELTGRGTLSIHPKSATGSGTVKHRRPNGSVVGQGTWTAVGLISFNSYGPSTDPSFPRSFEGGRALIRVHLSAGPDAILEVTCRLPGDNGPAAQGQPEAATLTVLGGPNFNKPVRAVDLFIRQ